MTIYTKTRAESERRQWWFDFAAGGLAALVLLAVLFGLAAL